MGRAASEALMAMPLTLSAKVAAGLAGARTIDAAYEYA